MTGEPREAVKCPHCGGDLHHEVVSRLMDTSRMRFTMAPHPGELLSARNVGGAVADMERLLVAIGKDMGTKTTVLIEGIETDDKGAITVKLLVARHEGGVKR